MSTDDIPQEFKNAMADAEAGRFLPFPPTDSPVPPAQPTDLAKMVEAAAEEISVLSERLNIDSTFTGIRPYEVSAILLRHLQPLAEQLEEAQEVKNAEASSVEARFAEFRKHAWDEQANLRAQLTAAQEELDRYRRNCRERIFMDCTPDEGLPVRILSAYIDESTVESVPPELGKIMTEAQRRRNEIIREYTALQSSAQKGAEDGKRLDAGLTRIYNEVEAYEEAAEHASQSQALANAILPTIRSLLAIVRARSAKND